MGNHILCKDILSKLPDTCPARAACMGCIPEVCPDNPDKKATKRIGKLCDACQKRPGKHTGRGRD